MIVAMLILGSGLWADDPWQDYLTRMQESKSDQEQITLIQETIPKISDINNLRMLQDAWKRRDPESCKAFFKDQYLSNPKSAEHHYLYLRSDDSVATVKAQIELCKKHPEFYWGYRC